MLNIKNGFCGSIYFTPKEWNETLMGKRLASHPLVNYKRQTHAAPTPAAPWQKIEVGGDRRPLAGIKAVELVRIIAGPVIGSILAAFGADIIRVDCKRTIDLDLTVESDRARLRKLLADADVFVQGFRPSAIARKGFGVNDLLKIAGNRVKGIVYVEENCYGPDGPYRERPGWQQIGDAASGPSYVMGRSLGYDPGTSVLPPLPISDMSSGLIGALGSLMALWDRARYGGSYRVTCSLVKVNVIALEPEVWTLQPGSCGED
ncbi:CoA-transferase family III domain-containing protein [Aspergillus falconensis]